MTTLTLVGFYTRHTIAAVCFTAGLLIWLKPYLRCRITYYCGCLRIYRTLVIIAGRSLNFRQPVGINHSTPIDVSDPAYKMLAGAMPSMSDTEREALDAGTSWWEKSYLWGRLTGKNLPITSTYFIKKRTVFYR